MKKLTKTSSAVAKDTAVKPGKALPDAISRRTFLRNSSLMAGGAALATSVSPVMMKKADAAVSATPGGKIEEVKTVARIAPRVPRFANTGTANAA
jgi:formate dehydrogenase major subunit